MFEIVAGHTNTEVKVSQMVARDTDTTVKVVEIVAGHTDTKIKVLEIVAGHTYSHTIHGFVYLCKQRFVLFIIHPIRKPDTLYSLHRRLHEGYAHICRQQGATYFSLNSKDTSQGFQRPGLSHWIQMRSLSQPNEHERVQGSWQTV